MPGTPFFSWAQHWVKSFLTQDLNLLFIPYAAVTITYDAYSDKVIGVFGSLGYRISPIHTFQDKPGAILNADGIIVGGGNTFALLESIYRERLLDPIRKKAASGTPYVGWSAGANVACPTIMTTNDMPVVFPPSFEALDLVPFQINPHYHELKFEGQGGETRKERLEEFIVKNPSKKVLGLPEGMLVQRTGEKVRLEGEGVARIYESGNEIKTVFAGSDVSFLLK